ncbi:hypothetical protein [Legionella rowbothamii]|uniref:hypothetical protein n=1 Tax=Legionella rowbothamii TaxID=96229 RepID=UPI001054D051|nr:hypothetical protein [Legionella rowbothamii]
MRRLFIAFLCAFLPWAVFLISDNPGGAFVALVMQATLIGWPFASVWAWRTKYPPKDKEMPKKNPSDKNPRQ